MAFKRALWHSGLTYQIVCNKCNTVVRYTDFNLDFRPWYADGFVYCPKCRTPLRHSENFAINEDGTYKNQAQTSDASQTYTPEEGKAFCPNCGRPYVKGQDHFCASCGNKLE